MSAGKHNNRLLVAIAVVIAVAALSLTPTLLSAGRSHGGYVGIDESIMEKRAEEAGRTPHPPLINTDQGDILLFVFTVGGLGAGIFIGYLGRLLLVEGRVERNGRAGTPHERSAA